MKIPSHRSSPINYGFSANSLFQSELIWARQFVVEPAFLQTCTEPRGTTTVWLVKSGCIEIDYHDSSRVVVDNEWYFQGCDSGFQHIKPGTELLSIRFDLKLKCGAAYYLRREGHIEPRERFPRLSAVAQKLVCANRHGQSKSKHLIESNDSPAAAFRNESLFYEWLSEYASAMDCLGEPTNHMLLEDSRVAHAVHFIDEFPMSEKFTEELVANEIGLCVNQLNRLFQPIIKESVYRYYERKRMDKALQMLLENEPIKMIAFNLGFCSSPHFSNWFRERKGVCPSEYRKPDKLLAV